jgi:hypothetical protein
MFLRIGFWVLSVKTQFNADTIYEPYHKNAGMKYKLLPNW